jgi:hypothetical protein
MPLKTDEATLEKKRAYYQANKQKILDRKHERQDIIYQNKVARNIESTDEFEKEMMRKFSKLDNERPDKCDLCGIPQEGLGYQLELHHFDYNETKGSFLCKPCHGESDRCRRRKE